MVAPRTHTQVHTHTHTFLQVRILLQQAHCTVWHPCFHMHWRRVRCSPSARIGWVSCFYPLLLCAAVGDTVSHELKKFCCSACAQIAWVACFGPSLHVWCCLVRLHTNTYLIHNNTYLKHVQYIWYLKFEWTCTVFAALSACYIWATLHAFMASGFCVEALDIEKHTLWRLKL